jgi:hypothetical protein
VRTRIEQVREVSLLLFCVTALNTWQQTGPAASATLDELVEWIKAELTKLGPILELEVVREPEGSRSEGGLPQPN